MGVRSYLLLLTFMVTNNAFAQKALAPTLNIGDAAPSLYVRDWLKGEPVEKFEKGKTYVVEFWSTWCVPCKASIPRLSKLARKYKHKAVFIGMDVWEDKVSPTMRKNFDQVKEFVDSMGRQMNYRVAVQDSNLMERSWLRAAGEAGIPMAFVVNAEGQLAWMGHPSFLEENLRKIVKGDWDVNKVLLKSNSDRRLENLDDSSGRELNKFYLNRGAAQFYLSDSALLAIADITKAEPKLKYAPNVGYYTLTALLINDPEKAYEYGKIWIAEAPYGYYPYDGIIDIIKWYSDKLTLSPEMYELGAEAYQAAIAQIPYPEIADMFKHYNKMADWYARANNTAKAIEAQRKAIKAIKKRSKPAQSLR